MPPAATELAPLVCVLRPPGVDAGACLAALAAAGVIEPLVLDVGWPGGWAAARNEALDRARQHELLGLVDADVVVAPAWLAAAGELDPSCAVIGGPVTAAGRGPGGIDAVAHAQVLGLSDGDRPLSGNVLLRTAALRAIGGFAPTTGHPASVDGLADWQLALESLAAAGWSARSDQRMAATRDLSSLTAATLLRRRLRTGARSAALNPRDRAARPGIAAARAAASAAGRLVRGDGAGALDRLAWSSAQLGSAAGPWLAHSELQPDVARTPWRPSVAAPLPSPLRARAARLRRPHRHAGLVLLYHRVCELPDDPLGVSVTPEHFAAQMELLARAFRPASLAAVAAGTAGPDAVAVTFDDGYVDNLVNALPILERTGVPATLFASTGQIASGEGYWWDTVERSVAKALAGGDPGPLTLELPTGNRSWRPTPGSPQAPLLTQLHAALRPLPADQVADAVKTVRAWAGDAGPPPERDRPMTVAELQQLAAAGPFDVQAHGRHHLSLAFTDPATRLEELRGSADDLERWLGARPTQFAYPFGVPGVDVDDATRQAARDAGFTLAVVNAAQRGKRDPFAVGRLGVPDEPAPAILRR